MKGWQIFSHSVRLVFNNIDAALRISLVLYLVYAAVQLYFMGSGMMMPAMDMSTANPGQMPQMPTGGQVLGGLAGGILSVIVTLWIAVAWHRYVLLSELPSGWVPSWHGGPVLGYFGRSLLVGLLAVVAALVVMLPASLLLALGPSLAMVGPLIGVAAGAYVFYRLCPILPAAAIGEPMSLGVAWTATAGTAGTILVLVALTVAASLVLQIPNILGVPGSVVSVVYSLVVGWFLMMIGVSVLTTFYGHYVEERGID